MDSCRKCNKPENKQSAPCLTCKLCKKSVHIECLSSKMTPGNFYGDTFFELVCENCSPSGDEIFTREKMSWLYVLSIALSHLSRNCIGISNNGFFHWRTHIGSFVFSNWDLLFDSSCKRKKNIGGSFSGILSLWNHIFFKSGTDVLKENGWWKISDGFSPSLIKYLYSEFSLWKQRFRKQFALFPPDKNTEYKEMKKILANIGFENLLTATYDERKSPSFENDCNSNLESIASTSHSKTVAEASNNGMDLENSDIYEDFSNYLMNCDDSLIMSNFEDILLDFDAAPEIDLNIFKKKIVEHPQTPPIKIKPNIKEIEQNDKENSKLKKPKSEDQFPAIENLFSNSASTEDTPWMKNDNSSAYKNVQPLLMTEYAEVQTLNRLNEVCRKAHFINIDKAKIRHRAKLALRRLKRNRHLPLFDVDNLVSRLAYYPIHQSLTHSLSERRVLDQFQVAETKSYDYSNRFRLVSSHELLPFVSPYSGKLLKPYIWRDSETISPWLKVMNEIKSKKNIVNIEKASLDYCYVRPQHIASINSLCEHYFWSGINLSDSLLYPEFSCIVLYKKIIVGFAFLVPDVSLNEAYISFIFTRPEWRKCGIASFMLYHLTQTCIDKDITLHVSASNPAIFLYQKFGFKIEEFLQEFYDKYFAPESKECKHAFFLRLSRS